MQASLNKKSGFSLLELSIILVIVGAVMAMSTTLGVEYIKKSKLKTTKERLVKIEEALDSYRKLNYRFPCPASMVITESTATFGNELGDGTACTAHPTTWNP
jgi:type II secretory pathway pseudopilin PulG